ncbi:MAG: dCTP deaminase [Thermoplasmata archaeon]
MILSDGSILELINQRVLSIDPFREERLTPNGYDFGLSEVVILRPGDGRQVESLESVTLPSYISAMMLLRSSYARKGVVASFGFVDAGFRGKIKFYLRNLGEETVEIVQERGAFQMIFLSMDKPALKTYEFRSGHYQNQGIK